MKSTFTKIEKCLLIITAIQSLMLVVAITCMVITYSKCINIDQKLTFFSNSNYIENANLSYLEISFSVLELETRTKLLEVVKDMNAVVTNMSQQINHLSDYHEVLVNATNYKLEQVRKEFEFHIINVTINTKTRINNFTMKIIADVMALHNFNSCEELGNLSLLFPSGIYRVRSYNCSFIHKYCSTNTAFSCSGVSGNWRRIAYVNTNDNLAWCPHNFEIRDPNSNPPLCARSSSIKCSSVIYPSNGISYSQVCGTVRIHAAGTPDGFIVADRSIFYVDGVYFTYGDSSNRNHIWTYSAAISFGKGCGPCFYQKPRNMPGYNFTCIAAGCGGSKCLRGDLWGNSNRVQQCFGSETFYRQLSESTTDNIEMRVCTDEPRSNEDIFISFVEIFVL